MHTMFIRVTIIFCTLVLFLQGCKKSCTENARNYTFNSEVALGVKRLDTINIYDTIKLKLLVPFNLRSLSDSILVDISNSKPSNPTIGVLNHNMVGGVQILKGLEDFIVTPLQGSFTQRGTGILDCLFLKQGQSYVFYVGIIPKKSGLVSLQLSSSFGDLKESCSVYTISNTFKLTELNHQFYYNLTGGNSNSVLLTERDFFIWVK